MIDTMLETGILAQNIVLGTVPDISDQALTDHGVDRSRLISYVRACRDVAVESGVRLVDCYEATRDRPELFVSNQGFGFDGIALSDAGHQVLDDRRQVILDAVRPWRCHRCSFEPHATDECC
jgi:hypothetical protein